MSEDEIVADNEDSNHLSPQDGPTFDIKQVPKRRVKLYQLNDDGQWDDKGTGHVGIFLVAGHHIVVMKSEDEPNEILLKNRISNRDFYQRQQETLIVFQDPDRSLDLALSFQEPDGCNEIWDEIQGHLMNIQDDSQQNLPNPEVGNLKEILNLVHDPVGRGKEILLRRIIDDDYIRTLLNFFHDTETQLNEEQLTDLFKIAKSLVMLNDSTILEALFDDRNIVDILGIFEYDHEIPIQSRMKHRVFISSKAAFKEVVPIDNPGILSKIHQNFRITYVKDVVLPRYLDDGTFGTLNSIIYFNTMEIATSLSSDSVFLEKLFSKLGKAYEENTNAVDLVTFLQELCNMSKTLQMHIRPGIYKSLAEKGIYDMLPKIITDSNISVRVIGTDILLSMINQDAVAVRKSILKQKPHFKLFAAIVNQLVVDTEVGVQLQLSEILKSLLDFTDGQRMHPEKDEVLSAFYDNFITTFCEPIMDNPEVGPEVGFDPRGQLKNIICDLMCFFLQNHTYRIKYHVLRAGVTQKVMQLAYHKEKYLVLSAIRFFKALIVTKDDFYFRSIIKLNLFSIVFEVFLKNGSKYNLINSAILELFEIIRKENIKSLINHIVETHEPSFAGVTYVETFKMLKLRYEQNREPAPRPEPRKPTNTRTSPSNFKDDEEEEEYFNRSDDEEEATPSTPPMGQPTDPEGSSDKQRNEAGQTQPPAPEKQQPSPNPAEDHEGVRLVDYDEGNDKDEEEAETGAETGAETVDSGKEDSAVATKPAGEAGESVAGAATEGTSTMGGGEEGAGHSDEQEQQGQEQREASLLPEPTPPADDESPPSKRQKSES